MPVLVPNRPVEQRSPVLLVENRFKPGVHRFALVVVDDSGSESEADVIAVTVRRAIVVEPVRPPVVGPVRPPIVDTRIDVPVRPPIAPVVTPVVNPVVVNPVVRPRGAPRKGKKHGPE
jgi:hypothetical protein